mmetsp:Transcript_52760/g.107636  ORF Transcript_52760/g.107636 Transcript_52760/m.107636 type:complete len:309 (+) Transcript_52760:79-1005(+)
MSGGLSLSSSMHGQVYQSYHPPAYATSVFQGANNYGPTTSQAAPTMYSSVGRAGFASGMLSSRSWRGSQDPSVYVDYSARQSREGMILGKEQERLRSEADSAMRLNQELSGSRAECERLSAALRNNEQISSQVHEEYRMYRGTMEQKEDEYRAIWSHEEQRIRHISEETRRNVDNVRSNLIGALEKMDVTNKNMTETMESLLQLDQEIAAVHNWKSNSGRNQAPAQGFHANDPRAVYAPESLAPGQYAQQQQLPPQDVHRGQQYLPQQDQEVFYPAQEQQQEQPPSSGRSGREELSSREELASQGGFV